jgi:hypothetical protein
MDVIPAKAGIHFDFAFAVSVLHKQNQDQNGSQLSLG